ncbi:MAG: hypothetical protein P4L39_01095 [Humidesulfovibrio sp.]|nr:hypothetical protein [Humidesulfovibrio sp.]
MRRTPAHGALQTPHAPLNIPVVSSWQQKKIKKFVEDKMPQMPGHEGGAGKSAMEAERYEHPLDKKRPPSVQKPQWERPILRF